MSKDSVRLLNPPPRESSPAAIPSALSNDRIDHLVATEFPDMVRPRSSSLERPSDMRLLPLARVANSPLRATIRPAVLSRERCRLIWDNVLSASVIRQNLGDAAFATLLRGFVRATLEESEHTEAMIDAEVQRHVGIQKRGYWIRPTPKELRVNSLLLVGEAAGLVNLAWRPGSEVDTRQDLRNIFNEMALHDSSSKVSKIVSQLAGVFRRRRRSSETE